MKEGLIIVSLFLAIFMLLIQIALVIADAKCEARAIRMKMNHVFSFTEGCMIEHKPGKWIPIANYRVEER